ncbi:MAG: hypothetical protein PHG04_02335 [Candidatus Nanoarchaeia archaeon]|nr:hypothetical protein [Candidatus Nanoarchaeia archaeon]MDD5054195.1 hypothetical protein [Candidatus Nanoarchaeia archaeon]
MDDLKKRVYEKFKKLDNLLKDKIIQEIRGSADYICDVSSFKWKSDKLEEFCPNCKKKFISIRFKSPAKFKKFTIRGVKFYSDEEL